MTALVQAIRGMGDILPDQTSLWQSVESVIASICHQYGFNEIKLPLVEKTALFKRSIGEVTDIVEKEMYTFLDRNETSLSLRPEGTASCVRAVLEHGLSHNQVQKLWYLGPMFRYERPQKGRYRQFYQFGAEVFGVEGPKIELELILMSRRLWQQFDLEQHLILEINSLGSIIERADYRQALVAYFNEHKAQLDDDSVNRLGSNPLRILDSKNEAMRSLIERAPKLIDFLNEQSLFDFKQLQTMLDENNIRYRVNPNLVRGLDYYSHTVFEWVTDELGAQGTVLAGGRYDTLVETLGGKPTPAVGFSMGIERFILLLQAIKKPNVVPPQADIYIIVIGEDAKRQGILLSERLRDSFNDKRILLHPGEGGFKSQFKKADKSGAQLALIIGEEELANSTISLKYLRAQKEQISVGDQEIIAVLQSYFNAISN